MCVGAQAPGPMEQTFPREPADLANPFPGHASVGAVQGGPKLGTPVKQHLQEIKEKPAAQNGRSMIYLNAGQLSAPITSVIHCVQALFFSFFQQHLHWRLSAL